MSPRLVGRGSDFIGALVRRAQRDQNLVAEHPLARFVSRRIHPLFFNGLKRYSLDGSPLGSLRSAGAAHSDWLTDEFIFLDDGLVSHEIKFFSGVVWTVVAEDVVYSWVRFKAETTFGSAG